MNNLRTWDIFCTVVDNYGDIGVCWRLARQLAAEYGLCVRLWVDDVGSFQRLCPEVNPDLPAQACRGVTVLRWTQPWTDALPGNGVADVVIEAFACALPERYVQAMAERAVPPLWINLEYLSAEAWVQGCHGLASPHPRLPLVKYFFFPGFAPGTGGLLADKALIARRDAFRTDPRALASFWQALLVPQPSPETLTVSLFAYENRAIGDLFAAWAEASTPVLCLVPEGKILADVNAYFDCQIQPGASYRKGNVEVRILPFMEQDRYDRLLWACACNFVRGEDSFVRAQWAARPFVWHIYPQDEGAHWKKLDAFLDLYCAGLPADDAATVSALWHAWNRGEGAGAAWPRFHGAFGALRRHAERWAADLAALGDLASNLVFFCEAKLK